jgi:hypothetical protein
MKKELSHSTRRSNKTQQVSTQKRKYPIKLLSFSFLIVCSSVLLVYSHYSIFVNDYDYVSREHEDVLLHYLENSKRHRNRITKVSTALSLKKKDNPYKSKNRSRNDDFASNISSSVKVDSSSPTGAHNNDNSSVFLQKRHFDRVGSGLSRPYVDQPPQIFSMEPTKKHKDSQESIYQEPLEGLFYVKLPKAASSTLAGINARISIRQGQRIFDGMNNSTTNNNHTTCTHLEHHLRQVWKSYGNRDPSRSFLWTSLRDPASRALSRIFYWHVSQGKRYHNTTDDVLIHLLMKATDRQVGAISEGQGGFQLKYLTFEKITPWIAWDKSEPTRVKDSETIQRLVKQIIDSYDFIALTERMDESLVVLQLLLGLPVGDILSTSAKVSGGFTYSTKKNLMKCIPIRKTVRSAGVHEYLTSERWYATNYGDYLLYAAANRSLDLTIERIGTERFEAALKGFRHAQKLVTERCDATAHFPCSADGTAQLELSAKSCYQEDEGCGYPCIDELSSEHGW